MLILLNTHFLLVFSLHSEIFRHISDNWCFLTAELVTGSWHGGSSIPPAHFYCLAWLQLSQPRLFDDSAFCVLASVRHPPLPVLFKVALCPMTADKCCMDIIEDNQVDVRQAFFLQIDYELSVSLKAQSISAMYINVLPKTFDCELACTSCRSCTGIKVPRYAWNYTLKTIHLRHQMTISMFC